MTKKKKKKKLEAVGDKVWLELCTYDSIDGKLFLKA
jgi:hypothetical protein